MARSDAIRGVKLSPAEQKQLADALRAATMASHDFPLLPVSDADASPHVPEEAGDNLTPAQRLAVAALVGGQTFAAAARAAGCTTRTLYDWRQQPDFARAVERTSRAALDVVVVRVRNLMLRATRVLGERMLEREDAPLHAMRVLNSPRLWKAAEGASDRAPAAESN